MSEPSAAHHPTRRGWMLIVAAMTSLALLVAAFLLPVPFVKLAPGPTFNVIGEQDGEPVIQISGAETFPTTGSLDMVTVLESGGPRGGLVFVDAIASWLDPDDAVVPRELIFPDDETGEEVERRQAISFSTSQSDAIAAAMGYLDRPIESAVAVTTVYSVSPAAGVLEPADHLLTVDGVEITAPAQVAELVRAQPIGTTFAVGIERDGQEQVVEVRSAPNPEDASIPFIGIGVGEVYSAGFPIAFTLEDVGGPSAGLMFATGIVDKLTPDDLAQGNHIAGTGTIAPDGTVGPIGGIRQKLAGARASGATLFLMPEEHCSEAAGHVPDGLAVVPVQTLADGIEAIRAHAAGQPVGSCPAADAP
ncbi:MAG: S16 family serine protease [Actinomycetota bacterium]|nr:S16 family serine protease [Actinomycetota bacterium]